MAEKIQEVVDELNSHLGEGPKLALVDPKELKLLDKNARYMDKETFDQLVSNIRRDGALESVPLCHKEGEVMTVLSGNHRVMAAREAGLPQIVVLYLDKPLSKGVKIAKQISHNAIVGKDDPVILKDLWGELDDIALRMYAGLDSETLKELEKLEFTSISESHMDFKAVTLAFLPEEAEALKEAVAYADVIFSGEEAYLLSRKHFDLVFNLVADIKEKFNIVNNPTAIVKIMELARERLDELQK
jgi:hypothetical protein